MAKKKFYAVKVGKTPGIYGTWSETEEQVKGFPGAVYKSFSTEEDAIRYISCEDIKEIKSVSDETSAINKKIEQEIKNLRDREVIAFVDGSHSLDADGKEKYSFGVLLLTNESEDSLYKAFIDKTYMDSRNIAGEIEGVKQAILWAIESNKQRIKIFMIMKALKSGQRKNGNLKSRFHRSIVNSLMRSQS